MPNISFRNLTDEQLIEHSETCSIIPSQLEQELVKRLKAIILQRQKDRESLKNMAEIIKNTDLLMGKQQGF